MKYKICKILFLFLFCCITNIKLQAQNYTGTWEGVTDDGEFVQINIVQIGTTICGYSWDYEMSNKKSFCKANFTGYYNKTRGICYVEGTSFIQNSGTHALMNLKFSLVYKDGSQMLEGALQIKSTMYSEAGVPSYFMLKKTSKKPTIVTSGMQACLPPIIEPTVKVKTPTPATPKKQNGSVTKPKTKPSNSVGTKPTPKPSTSVVTKPTVIKPKVTAPPVVKKPAAQNPPVVKNIDPIKTVPPPVIIPNKPQVQIVKVPEVTNGRKNNEQSRITLSEKKINLSIYDNGTVDGDTVSIFFDGKLVVNKKRLTSNAISVDLELDESINPHTLILYAENLGTIAPNTALVIVTTASGKRYELYSSATLEKNAALIFEYKPK
jgi:hypothetical protein